MQSNNHPNIIITAFAEFGAKNPIPDIKPPGAPANFASYREGYPAITRILKSAGGIPPEGLDINGVLYDLSNAIRWMQAGAKYPFDATFAAAIGGYPSGAEVLGNDGVTIYRSVVENNQNDPNSTHAGWLVLSNDAGQVAAFAMQTAPNGYLPADGAAVSRATYANLFAKIGVTFGAGDGITTFNLPDVRGEFVRGWPGSKGVDVGRAFGSLQMDDFKDHKHVQIGYQNTYNNGLSGSINIHSTTGGQLNSGPLSTESTGGAETRPRNIALLYCIKY